MHFVAEHILFIFTLMITNQFSHIRITSTGTVVTDVAPDVVRDNADRAAANADGVDADADF